MWRFIGLVLLLIVIVAGIFYLKGPSDKLPTGGAYDGAEVGEPNIVAKSLGHSGLPKPMLPLPPSPLGAHREPILVNGCTLAPIAEQPVGSRVDGKLQENLIKLGDHVTRGQLLGRMDEVLARQALEVARVKAESNAAVNEARKKVNATYALLEQVIRSGQSSSREEVLVKTYQYEQAQAELERVLADKIEATRQMLLKKLELELHQLRTDIDGTVVKVNKRPGSPVRAGETLYEVVNTDQLWIEALLARELAQDLKPGMRVRVEPEWAQAPERELRFHTAPVTGLAVSPDSRLLASSSEDGRVAVWDWRAGKPIWFGHNRDRLVEFLAVAFSTVVEEVRAGVRQYRLLAGGADGAARYWTLEVDALGRVKEAGAAELRTDAGGHVGRIQALAFSLDGRFAATGATDAQILLWNLETGKLLYKVKPGKGPLAAHRGFVTSLLIASDGQETHLVSVATDKTIKRWLLGDEAAQLLATWSGRTGDVSHLAISPDGKRALFDHADELRVVNLVDGSEEGIMHSQNGQFRNLALVIPSSDPHYPTAHLTLTTTAQGRLQLRTLPTKRDEEAFFRNGYRAGFRKNSLLVLNNLSQRLCPWSWVGRGLNIVLSAEQPAAPPLPTFRLEPGFPTIAAPGMTPFIDVEIKPYEGLAAVPELWSLGSYELRYLKMPDGANVTCGAYAPVRDAAYPHGAIFTGGTDRVIRIWAAPDPREQQNTIEAVLTYVGAQAETTTTPLVRIRAELDNPTDPRRRLMPNTKVNLTIFPEAVK